MVDVEDFRVSSQYFDVSIEETFSITIIRTYALVSLQLSKKSRVGLTAPTLVNLGYDPASFYDRRVGSPGGKILPGRHRYRASW